MNPTKKTTPFIFIVFLVVASILLTSVYNRVVDSYSEMQSIIEQQQLKRELLTAMYNSARERSIILLKMTTNNDPFDLDDMQQELGIYAREFIRARTALSELPLSTSEISLLQQQNELTMRNAPLQDQAAELLLEGKKDEAFALLFEEAIPGQRAVLDHLNNIIGLYNKESSRLAGSINSDLSEFGNDFFLLGLILLISMIIAVIIVSIYISRLQKQENELIEMLHERKRASEQLSYQASHDALTGLPNRIEFEIRLQNLIDDLDKSDSHVVFYLDLDQFKIINDSCGHHAGDELLCQVAEVIKNNTRHSDVLARLGGDEFGIILEHCAIQQAKSVAHNIIDKVSNTYFAWHDKPFRIGISIGIAQIDTYFENVSEVLKKVDAACYAAKDAGRNRYHIYSADDVELQNRRDDINWISRIEQSLLDNSLNLYAQPIVSTDDTGSASPCFELLVRMKQDDRSMAMPGAFLPSAERYGKMVQIDSWVVNNSIRFLSDNPTFLSAIDYCSINISAQALTDENFLSLIIEKLSRKKDIAGKICFEITETAAISNFAQARDFIATLSDLGCRFALDDFGSGLSSFGYLKNLDVEYLKIDGMFIKDITDNEIDYAMVKSIHEVGKVMGKKTIAEFVENQQILDLLKKIGVDYAQGYGIGKPVPLEDAVHLVMTGTDDTRSSQTAV